MKRVLSLSWRFCYTFLGVATLLGQVVLLHWSTGAEIFVKVL